MTKKSYNQKLQENKDLPKIVEVTDPKAVSRYGGVRMLIAPPMAYDTIMKKIPFGMVITADYIRDYLARKYDADYTCPLTAGIFINIAAHASQERGADETPYWRTLKKDGELNEKYPDGIDGQKFRLEMEGHNIIKKGKKYYVHDYKETFFTLD